MELELYSVVAAVILIATLLTAFFTLVTYTVFQVRKRRKVPAMQAPAAPEPRFFRRYETTR
jgi:hypothetical protein